LLQTNLVSAVVLHSVCKRAIYLFDLDFFVCDTPDCHFV